MGRKVIGSLSFTLGNRNIKETELLIHKKIVKIILLHGAENLNVKQKYQNKLLFTEMDYVRHTPLISKLDKFKNGI